MYGHNKQNRFLYFLTMYGIPHFTARDGIIPSAPVPSVAEEYTMLSFRLSCRPADTWSEQTFAPAPLGARRRGARAAAIAQAMAQQPGASIPDLFDDPYDVKAAYNLFDRREATPDRLQAPHRAQVLAPMQTPGQTYLIPSDTSEISWSGNQQVAGLGPIGRGTQGLQGFLLHSALAVRWPAPAALLTRRPPLEILGLIDQLYEVRRPRPAGEKRGDSKARQNRQRESHFWQTQSRRIGPAPAGVRWEAVCDRGADIYEFLAECQAQGHGFTVRAAQDRALVEEAGSKAPESLFSVARAAPALGQFELFLRARSGQPERTAQLAVASARVRLRAPQRPGQSPGALAPLECTVVRVFEVDPPANIEPLEWILLTDAVVATFEEALEVALKYNARWLIEEFHKGLKTGLGAERLQLETAARLFAAIAIMSIVALRLIDLREALRLEPQAPVEEAGELSKLELAVLRARLKRTIRTVGEAALAIGRLGGHMNRKSDGPPGWLTLWRGMKKLRLLVQGVLLTKDVAQFG
jgi:hypothetical protein